MKLILQILIQRLSTLIRYQIFMNVSIDYHQTINMFYNICIKYLDNNINF